MANYAGFCQFVPAYHCGAIAEQKSDLIAILHSLLRHIRDMVGEDPVLFVKFDGGSEFVTEDALQIYHAWHLDYSITCRTHH